MCACLSLASVYSFDNNNNIIAAKGVWSFCVSLSTVCNCVSCVFVYSSCVTFSCVTRVHSLVKRLWCWCAVCVWYILLRARHAYGAARQHRSPINPAAGAAVVTDFTEAVAYAKLYLLGAELNNLCNISERDGFESLHDAFRKFNVTLFAYSNHAKFMKFPETIYAICIIIRSL